MKKTIATVAATLFAVVVISGIYSFTNQPEPQGKEFMQVTTVESIIPGGLGRSRMFITDPTGRVEDSKMKNFYSMVGINFGNINENDAAIVNTINRLSREGWTLEHITTGVQSPSTGPDGGKGEGLYMTRYLFAK